MLDFLQVMTQVIIVATLLAVVGYGLHRANLLKQALCVFFGVLLLGGAAIATGHAEDITTDEGLRAQVVKVDLDKKLVTVKTEDGKTYRYKAEGEVDVFHVRIRLNGKRVEDAKPDIAVKAMLVGFDLSLGCFKLQTENGDIELFELGVGNYVVGDEYIIYYADGFAPICKKQL